MLQSSLLNCSLSSSFVIGIFNSELFLSELAVSIISDEDSGVEVEDEDEDVGVEDVEDDELLESVELDIFSGSVLDFVGSTEDVEDSTISNFFFCGIPDIILIY